MKLNITSMNLESFIEALDDCKGQIWLSTKEGDRINLKSKLSQLVGLTNIIKGATVTDAEITCELKEDEMVIVEYLMYG